MENFKQAALAYAMAVANYHFVESCAHQPWELRSAKDAMYDAQNFLNDLATEFSQTDDFLALELELEQA
jgi:hypothetical protein